MEQRPLPRPDPRRHARPAPYLLRPKLVADIPLAKYPASPRSLTLIALAAPLNARQTRRNTILRLGRQRRRLLARLAIRLTCLPCSVWLLRLTARAVPAVETLRRPPPLVFTRRRLSIALPDSRRQTAPVSNEAAASRRRHVGRRDTVPRRRRLVAGPLPLASRRPRPRPPQMRPRRPPKVALTASLEVLTVPPMQFQPSEAPKGGRSRPRLSGHDVAPVPCLVRRKPTTLRGRRLP